MNRVASDFFTLANCARATIYDAKNMFLIKSILTPIYYQTCLDNAKTLNPDNLGLTDDFIQYAKDLVDSCNTTTNSNVSKQDKLKALVSSYQ